MFTYKAWKQLSFSTILVLLGGLMASLTSSCQKTEGRGGTGSISGTLIESFYNEDYSRFFYQGAAVDEDVFVLYGEEKSVGDKVVTGPTGEFKFKYLYPGRYYIYHASRDSAAPQEGNIEKMYALDLADGQDLNMGELKKLNTLDYDEGNASIRGVVRVISYDPDSKWPNLVVEYTDFAFEQEVYLTYGNHTYYDERIRTQHDGSFEFSKLIPGEYLIFLYSEDVTRVKDKVVLKFEVSITEMDELVDLGEITIQKI